MNTTLSNSPFTTLVEFSWGSGPTIARYARYPEDVTIGGDTFTALPQMGATNTKANNAGTDEDEFEVRMPVSKAPATRLALPFKHAPVTVRVYESFLGDTPEKRLVFSGRVGKVSVRSQVILQIRSAKARLNIVTLGAPATSTCLNTFGRGKCKFDIEAARLPITIAEITPNGVPNQVRVTYTGTPTVENEFFRRGYILIDGLSIGIRKVLEDVDNTIELREIVPPYWDGLSGFMYPGCDKSIEACRVRDQEARFLAPGYAMPEYNPAFSDDPQGG
jgi:hypothetical protein